MLNKKKGLRLAVLSMVGLLGLTACDDDEIYSKPSDYDKPIVTIDGKTDIHNDVLSIVYDAMHDGSLNSKVLDEALYRYAKSVFGEYNKVTAPADSTEVTLKEAYVSYVYTNSVDKINAFIKAHKSYWNYNENGEHVDDTGVKVDDATFTPCSAEREHVVAKYLAIEKRIATSLYEKSVASSNYKTNSFFSEYKFLRSLYEDGQKVTNPSTVKATLSEIVVPYTVEKEDIFDEFDDFNGNPAKALHREYYQDSASYTESDSKEGVKNTYVEDELLPSIYNDLLVEQYLLDEDVAAVRNSRARKINVIKIARHSAFADNATALKKHLVESIYSYKTEGLTAPRTNAEQIEEDGVELFATYAQVAKGLYEDIQADDAAKAIVEAISTNRSDIYEEKSLTVGTETYNYYNHTTYGDLVKDYKEIYDQVVAGDSKLIDSSLYSTFTSSGTRTLQEGFDQQNISILQTESITRGWFIQSSSPTLDSNGKINERLFKLSVANAKIEIGELADGVKAEVRDAAIAELTATDRLVYSAEAGALVKRDAPAADENKFLCSINGAFYLKFEGQYAEDEWYNDIVYDDGSAYYVVQVLEAVKDMKLRNVSSKNYAQTRGQSVMDEITDDVAKLVGETGNYASLSKNHWLEKMDIYYYDESVYNYFKSNYPDLFEDED